MFFSRVIKNVSVAGSTGAFIAFLCWAFWQIAIGSYSWIVHDRFWFDRHIPGLAILTAASCGGYVGALTTFINQRKILGYVSQYLWLVALGASFPVSASIAQYYLYRSDAGQFSFDDKVLGAVGKTYSTEKLAVTEGDIVYLDELITSTDVIIAELGKQDYVSYQDPEAFWLRPKGCRRLNLGRATDLFCVRNEYINEMGGSYHNYWPVLNPVGNKNPARWYKVTLELLSGPYECRIWDGSLGSPGFYFFQGARVPTREPRACLVEVGRALKARKKILEQEKTLYAGKSFMPYWYFLSSTLISFVGSSGLPIQPLGFMPVTIAVLLAMFKFVYLSVLVTTWLADVSKRSFRSGLQAIKEVPQSDRQLHDTSGGDIPPDTDQAKG